MKKKIAFFLAFSCSLFAGCSHLLTLQKSGAYHRSDERIDFSYTIDETRAKEIREYFTKNTGLDLESINKKESDMEKVLLIADFISKNIPHANQKSPIKNKMPFLFGVILSVTIHDLDHSDPSGIRVTLHHGNKGEPESVDTFVVCFCYCVLRTASADTDPFLLPGKAFLFKNVCEGYCHILSEFILSHTSLPPQAFSTLQE